MVWNMLILSLLIIFVTRLAWLMPQHCPVTSLFYLVYLHLFCILLTENGIYFMPTCGGFLPEIPLGDVNYVSSEQDIIACIIAPLMLSGSLLSDSFVQFRTFCNTSIGHNSVMLTHIILPLLSHVTYSTKYSNPPSTKLSSHSGHNLLSHVSYNPNKILFLYISVLHMKSLGTVW